MASAGRLRFGRVVAATGPAAFTLVDQTSVPTSTQYASPDVTLEGGGGGPWTVTVTDGEYSKNGGGYTSAPGSAEPGDTLSVRRTSSASLATAVSATLNVGTTSDTFSLTTVVNTEASAFITRLRAKTTDPGSSRRRYYDEAFTALKVGPVNGTNLLPELDALYLFQSVDEVSGRENLVQDAYHLTPSATAPSFEANMGFTGGTGIYLDTGFNPAVVVGEKWGGSAAHIMLYSRTDSLGDVYDFGQSSGGSATRWSLRNASGGVSRALVNNASLFSAGSNTTSIGTFVLNRTGSTTVSLYQDGVLSGSPAVTGSASSTNGVFAILGNAVSPTTYSTRQISACSFGADLTANQVADLHEVIMAYALLAENGDPGPPTIVTPPAVTGIGAVDQTLTATDGTYRGNPVPTSSKKWTRNGVDIPGETGDTYLIVAEDIGADIQCVGTGTNIHGSTEPNLSNVVVPVEFLTITAETASDPNSFESVCALIQAADPVDIEVKVYIPSDADEYSKKIFGSVDSVDYLLMGGTLGHTVTFQAAEAGVRINRTHCRSGSNATKIFNDFHIWSSETPMTEPVTWRVSHPGDVIWNDCLLQGNDRGALPPAEGDFDCTSSDYPVYAHVRAIVTGGVITGATIVNDVIDNNWGDGTLTTGTCPITVTNNSNTQPSGGTGATGWSINIVDGVIVSVNAGTGGTGYSSAAASLDIIFSNIDGRQTPQGLLDFAFRSSGSSGHASFYNCSIDWLSRGIVCSHNNITIEGCTFDRTWGDFMQADGGTGGGPIRIRWNVMRRMLAKGTDPGNPHGDGLQVTSASATSDVLIDIEGNIALADPSRGYFQGFLISNMNASGTAAYTGRVANNLMMTAGANINIDFSRTRDLYIGNNTCLRHDITDPNNVGTTSQITFNPTSNGSVLAIDNIAELALTPPPSVYKTGNVVVTALNAAAYAAALVDYNAIATTISGAMTAYMTQGPALGKGAVRTGNPVDYINRTVDVSAERVYAYFATYLDAPLSTQVTSGWVKIIGGPDTGAYSVTGSGFAVQFADDRFGTNATATSTSGTYTRDKYIQAVKTTGSVNNTTATGTITLGGFAYTWDVITLSAASYVAIDNQATGWSLLANPGLGTATNHNMLVMSYEFRIDNLFINKAMFSRTSSNDHLAIVLSGNIIQFLHGAANLKTSDSFSAGVWYRMIILIDTTTQRADWIVNASKATLGTQSVTLNGTFNLNTLFNTSPGLGMFGSNAGALLLDGRLRYFYWHSWRQADFPSITIPAADTAAEIAAWYNRFSPDNVNLTNGDGVLLNGATPVQPLGFWTATDVTEANSAGGIPNRGSVASRPFIKQAGTYAAG
jgi:hypothetical protein